MGRRGQKNTEVLCTRGLLYVTRRRSVLSLLLKRNQQIPVWRGLLRVLGAALSCQGEAMPRFWLRTISKEGRVRNQVTGSHLPWDTLSLATAPFGPGGIKRP